MAAARLKNDKVDAYRLALLLRGDLLPTVWIPPAAVREARDLVRHRVGLIWLRTQVRTTASQTGEGVGSGVRPIVVDFTRCRRASSVDLPT